MRQLPQGLVARGVALVSVDLRQGGELEHDDGKGPAAALCAAGLRVCHLVQVAVRVEQRDVIGGSDRAMAEQGLVALAAGLHGRYVERLHQGALPAVPGSDAAHLLHEDACDVRVELRAGAALDLLAGLLGGNAAPVGASGGERGVGVGDSDHAGFVWNLLACQTGWVAAAIPALVVVVDRRGESGQARNAFDDAAADQRMQLGDLALLGAQGAWSQEHAVGDAELADVSQHAGEDQALARAGVEVEPPPDRLEAGRHLVRARPRERILGLDRVGEDAHNREVGAAQAPVEAVVLEHRAGVASEREQHVVVELLEAAGAVGADHDALEVVVHVHGDRHERVDLVVGRRVAVARGVLADDRVAFDHALAKALRDRALAGVALEAAVADQVELAVAVPVTLG